MIRPAVPARAHVRTRARAAAAAAFALLAVPAMAQDFSEGSQAKEWGLAFEQKSRFDAKVVDILCQLSGDCPADCGGGHRQMGLLREADGALILAVKNTQPVFSGAAVDLHPYCGQDVAVDGLMVRNEDIEGAPPVYQLQTVTPKGGAPAKANRFTKVWAERNPEAAKKKGPWFRKDPRVNAHIERTGWLGLGLKTDAAFLKEWFE